MEKNYVAFKDSGISEKVETLVIGAGQAGIAMSEHLGKRDLSHLVVERHRIAERWRSERWDSLVANGPAWHDRFPNMKFDALDPDSFPPKESMAEYFVAYAKQIDAPIRCGIEVKALLRNADNFSFSAETSEGIIEAKHVVVATGPFQRPVVPPIVPAESGIFQIHSNAYRNPQLLPKGAVLVVGSGASGSQIADELQRAGRKVYLCVGPHNKPPRRYRGHDYCWWLGVLGKWDVKTPNPGTEHITVAVSGARGGHTVDFRQLAADGMTLLGMAGTFKDGTLQIAPDLVKNIRIGDADYRSVLDCADAYAKNEGLDLPEEPMARAILPDPACMTDPILQLNFAEAGMSSVVWATGYVFDFSWMKLNAFDEKGRPKHDRGISEIPGLYFLGLPWLSSRSSSFIWGVWRDAEYLASHIAGNAI